MKDLLKKLSIEMKELEQQKEYYNKKKKEFEDEMKSTKELINGCNNHIENLKTILSDLAIKEFKETNKKQITGGLGIRETKKIKYDEKKALAFAKEKDMFLTLDKKAFEKAASSLDLDFLDIEKNITVTFPKKIEIGE